MLCTKEEFHLLLVYAVGHEETYFVYLLRHLPPVATHGSLCLLVMFFKLHQLVAVKHLPHDQKWVWSTRFDELSSFANQVYAANVFPLKVNIVHDFGQL